MLKQTPIYISGEDGYHTYRIPVLVVSGAGTILAFCEGRRNAGSDSGDIDIVLKRSFDGGVTWQPMQVAVHTGPDVDGNPAPVLDASTGRISLVFCKNLADGNEGEIVAGRAPRTVWVTHSDDDGESWTEPEEITQSVKDPSWSWYATGPCHGIQLSNGRLMIPCDHVVGNTRDYAAFLHSHVIHSDDHGESWHIGGIAQAGTSESVILEAADGRLYFNCRNHQPPKRRAYAWSSDHGDTFTEFGYHENLVEPHCQASMIRYTDTTRHSKNRALFSNPASEEREQITVRLSEDECRTWNAGKLLHAGPAAYSDLCITPDMRICCLYECGEERPYETLTFAQFDLDWLTDGVASAGPPRGTLPRSRKPV